MDLLSILPFRKAFYIPHRDPLRSVQKRIFLEVQRGCSANVGLSLETFHLPAKYGLSLPERVVELLLARLTYKTGARVLDIGFSNAMDCHLRTLLSLPIPRNFTGIDIAKPTYDTSPYYAHATIGSIVEAPFLPGSFDLIWCISTLEHVGMDNSGYNAKASAGKEGDAEAIRSMLDLLRPSGSALITVPYGKYEDHTWFRNYDSARWQSLLSIIRPDAFVTEWYFRHSSADGWNSVTPDTLNLTGYRDENNFGAAGLAAALVTRGTMG